MMRTFSTAPGVARPYTREMRVAAIVIFGACALMVDQFRAEDKQNARLGFSRSAESSGIYQQRPFIDNDTIVITGSFVTYANGYRGSWSDSVDRSASTYQTWDPLHPANAIAEITVPIASKQALSTSEMVLKTLDGEREMVNARGVLIHVEKQQ